MCRTEFHELQSETPKSLFLEVVHFSEVTRAGTELRAVTENLRRAVEFSRAPLANRTECQTVLAAGYF